MGVQLNLQDIQSGFLTAAAHTANNTLIEAAMDKALDRTGSTNNAMEVDLDMGNQRGINAASGILNSDLVNLGQLNLAVGALASGDVSHIIERKDGSDAVSRVFTLTSITYTVGNDGLMIYRNGQLLDLTEDYTETNSTTVTLTFDPNPSDKFKFMRWATV